MAQTNQVCVESPSSALNMTLPAFAAERRRCTRSAPTAIDRYLLPAGRSAANPQASVAAVDQPSWNRSTEQQQQPFNGRLSGTTRVGRYQKKHSPAHAHPGQRTSFITFLH